MVVVLDRLGAGARDAVRACALAKKMRTNEDTPLKIVESKINFADLEQCVKHRVQCAYDISIVVVRQYRVGTSSPVGYTRN